jgi:glutathione synthase/RimK-type ligase-like ATP-grasp enzyme
MRALQPIDVALASCAALPEPDPDEAPLLRALRERGVRVEVLAWDDPAADFARARLTVIRATWNYHRAPESFARWVGELGARGALVNAPEVVLWNMHKRYLLELGARGIPVLPTELVAKGASRSLAAFVAERGFRELVIKPAVSAGSRGARRFGADELGATQGYLDALSSREDALVQPYVPEVEQRGERSLVWIDGEVTHALRKAPRFDGQDEAITVAPDISAAERELALRTVAAVGKPLFYARIDLVTVGSGPMLMELELIEPSLYFDASPAALARFADGVVARLGSVKG